MGEKVLLETDGKKVTETLIDQDQWRELFKLACGNDVVIIGQGSHIQHFMNGRLILDFTDNDPELSLKGKGVLALQLHAGKPMWAEFKDIRIKELK